VSERVGERLSAAGELEGLANDARERDSLRSDSTEGGWTGIPPTGLYTISRTASSSKQAEPSTSSTEDLSVEAIYGKALRPVCVKLRAGPCMTRPLVGLNMVKLAPLIPISAWGQTGFSCIPCC
jgi:hypothetical protein